MSPFKWISPLLLPRVSTFLTLAPSALILKAVPPVLSRFPLRILILPAMSPISPPVLISASLKVIFPFDIFLLVVTVSKAVTFLSVCNVNFPFTLTEGAANRPLQSPTRIPVAFVPATFIVNAPLIVMFPPLTLL